MDQTSCWPQAPGPRSTVWWQPPNHGNTSRGTCGTASDRPPGMDGPERGHTRYASPGGRGGGREGGRERREEEEEGYYEIFIE